MAVSQFNHPAIQPGSIIVHQSLHLSATTVENYKGSVQANKLQLNQTKNEIFWKGP